MKTKKRKTTKITVPTALALICCFAVILIINNQPTENTAKDEIISLKDIPHLWQFVYTCFAYEFTYTAYVLLGVVE